MLFVNYYGLVLSNWWSHLRLGFLCWQFLFKKIFFSVLFIFERERGQRERETQNLKQALGFELSAQSPMRGLNSWTVRSWPELELDTQPTEPPRHPCWQFLIMDSTCLINYESLYFLSFHSLWLCCTFLTFANVSKYSDVLTESYPAHGGP